MASKITAYRDIELGRISVLPSGKRRIELRFMSTDGSPGQVLMDVGEIAQLRTLQRRLRNAGYGGTHLTRGDALALDALTIRYARSARGRAAVTPIRINGGWDESRSQFTLDDLEIPTGRLVFRSESGGKRISAIRGTIDGWKSTVGAYSAYSSRAMLMICAALAAPSLVFCNVETGGFGFNIWGPSSTGKSTALRAAASILSPDFAGTWNGTTRGLQDLAQKYCDLPLTVDSMESVTGEGQRDVADAVAYALGSGMARVRTRTWSDGNSAVDASWRTVLLSTAEAKAQRGQRSGAAVRFVDIPVSPNTEDGLGIIDYFPAKMGGADRSKFAASTIKHIQRGAARQHGHVIRAYVAALAKKPKLAQERLTLFRAKFLEKFDGADLSNTERRMLDHFAITFAAGRLGVQLGLLPWDAAHLQDAITRCATDALANTSDQMVRNAKNADRVVDWVFDTSRRVIELTPAVGREDLVGAEILAAGFTSHDRRQGVGVRMALRPVLQNALKLTAKELASAMTLLKQSGRLITEARDDALTMQHKFKDCSARFYVLRDEGE